MCSVYAIHHMDARSYRDRMRFRDRPTGDILVLMIAITVCSSVLASGVVIAIVMIKNPTADLTVWISRITGTVNTMIGLLAGFLAGRQSREKEE